MSAPLKWALAGTLLATVASLLWPARDLVPAQGRADDGPPRRAPFAGASMPAKGSAAAAAAPTPSAPRTGEAGSAVAAARFDPFIGVVPPPQPAPQPIVQPAVAPPPAPPAQDYRFLGRVTAPDGSEQILLIRGDAPVAVSAGTPLDNGYVVDSISDDALMLVYPPLGTKVSIPIGASRAGL